MPDEPKRGARNAQETRAKIVEVAQQLFSEKGYPHAGLREIAKRAEVAVSLIIKHFGSKAALFDRALNAALIDPAVFQSDRARFGRKIVEAVSDPKEPMLLPSMIALSLGDQEARGIIEHFAADRIFAPMAEWLGKPLPEARAEAILMLTTGYAILTRSMPSEHSTETARILASSLQAIVDEQDSA